MTSRPSGESLRTPGELMTGVSRLATHTTVGPGMLAYQMPRYVLPSAALSGVKKPSSKTRPAETIVWLPVMDAALPMVSVDVEEVAKVAAAVARSRRG
jgi:hypothetical protein